jgi:N-acetylmuramoyl-L-alanine amidase-like protein
VLRRLTLLVALLSTIPAVANAGAPTNVVRRLPFATHHVAVYWKGHQDAHVRVAFGNERVVDAGRDEPDPRDNGWTYGAVLQVPSGRTVHILSNQVLAHLKLVAIPDHPLQTIHDAVLPKNPVPTGHVARPAIESRAQWGADESLRYSNGKESWPPVFEPVHKLIVHHTDTTNNDPNPASTVRAIYYYHAITRGWGDIGYNFLIDASGTIYKGRNSHGADGNDTITGQDAQGNGVIGAHAHDFNAGSVGVALLGTLDAQDATPAAKSALDDLLAWEADAHGIDPHGSSPYTNPVEGNQKTFPNIAGHRDVGETDCPGGTFYATLPQVRDAVSTRMTRSR